MIAIPRQLLVLACALALWPPSRAEGQASLPPRRPLTTGVLLPPTSVAWEQSPFALSLNPGGLGLGSSGLAYLHEDDERAFPGARRSDGLFANYGGLVAGGTSSFGAALSVEWLRGADGACSTALPCTRRTSLGWALGNPSFSAGFAFRWFSTTENADLDRAVTFDLGFIWRPARWLSFGAAASPLNAPRIGGIPVARLGTLGLGLRPFGPRLSLAADFKIDDDTGWTGAQFAYALGLTVLEGVELVAQVDHAASDPGAKPVVIQVGLRGGFGHASVGFAGAGIASGPGSGASLVADARVFAARGPALLGAARTAQTLDLKEELQGPSGLALLFRHPGELDAYTRLALRLQRLADDPSLDTLVLEVRGLGDISLGRVEELRGLVSGLRASGRRVVAWLPDGGDAEYYLATSADRIYAAPQAMLLINGFASERFYLRGLLDKLGVLPEFVAIGAYKSAPEQFTREGPSEASTEVTNALLDDQFTRYVQAIADARRLSTARVKELLDRGVLLAEEAVELGLVDGVSDEDKGLDEEITKLAGRPLPRRRSAGPDAEAPVAWGRETGIALVEVVGNIAPGEGTQRILRELRKAAADSSIAAIVLRVESPGGDVGASELIWQAVAAAKKRKPVVASFGDVAASGGYYVAAAADAIVAEPSTLTGSIGVFAGKADLSTLYGNVGVGTDLNLRGDKAALFTTQRPWTPAERTTVEGLVSRFYETFLQRVAVGRKMSRDDVHAVAQGRVWTGAQARQKGLVDELGGLDTALRLARSRAGIDASAPVRVVGSDGLFELPDLPSSPVPPGVKEAVALRALEWLSGAGAAETGRSAAAGAAFSDEARFLVQALLEGTPLVLAVDLPLVR